MEVVEKYNTRNDVIITGILQRANENVRQTVINLAEKWKIATFHRLYSKMNTPNIILNLTNRDKVKYNKKSQVW